MHHEEEDDELLRALSDPLVWGEGLHESSTDVAARFAEREAEEDEAAKVCDFIVAGPRATWAEKLRATDVRTAGLVRALLARVPVLLETRRVSDALEATSIALAVAEALDARKKYRPDHVTYVRAQALREHAWILTLLGRSAEALQHIARSATEFAGLDPELVGQDVARLQKVRALALRQVERAEALEREAG